MLYSCALSSIIALIAAVTASKSFSACSLLSTAEGVPVYTSDCLTINWPSPNIKTSPDFEAIAYQSQSPTSKLPLSVALIVNSHPVLL